MRTLFDRALGEQIGDTNMTTTIKHDYKAPADMATESELAALLVSPAPLAGTWKNIDPATRSMVKLVVTVAGTGLSVEAFGACSPTPCDWGRVPAVPYAATVSTSPAVAFTATYKFSFKQTIVTGHISGKNLIVETFDVFTDGSGRSNYYSSNTMTR
jgi:hypothetical protein